MISSERLQTLQAFYPEAQLVSEASVEFVLLPRVVLPNGKEVAALLLPATVPHFGGYTSRLFLSERTNKELNWQPYSIFGRTWYSWSWNHISAEQPLASVLAAHLNILR